MINWIKANDSAIDAATICSNALLYVISGDIKHRDITGDIWYSVGAAEDRTIENLSTATNVLGARSSIQSTRSRNHLYYTHIYIYIHSTWQEVWFPLVKVPENIFLYKKSGIYCKHLWQKTPYYTALRYGYYNTNGCIIYRVVSQAESAWRRWYLCIKTCISAHDNPTCPHPSWGSQSLDLFFPCQNGM